MTSVFFCFFDLRKFIFVFSLSTIYIVSRKDNFRSFSLNGKHSERTKCFISERYTMHLDILLFLFARFRFRCRHRFITIHYAFLPSVLQLLSPLSPYHFCLFLTSCLKQYRKRNKIFLCHTLRYCCSTRSKNQNPLH